MAELGFFYKNRKKIVRGKTMRSVVNKKSRKDRKYFLKIANGWWYNTGICCPY